MRMTRDVELIAAAVFSDEHLEIGAIKCLADLELNADLKQHVARFEEIATHISSLPADIQFRLAEVARLGLVHLGGDAQGL